LKTIFA
jgi:FAD-dependent oxidoreductase domain-containing protein 1